MIGRIFFYPTLAFNFCWSSLANRPWYNRIDETVIVGALPLRTITKTLAEKENVKAMVTMNEDYELKFFTPSYKELQELGIERLHLSTPDLTSTPTQEQLDQGVQFILSHKARNNSVYVHCKAGKTRSATVAVCYLMKLHGWDPDTAITFLKSKRPVIWLRTTQMKSVYMFHKRLTSS